MALLLTESFDYWNDGITTVMWPAGGWTYHTTLSHYAAFYRHGSGSGYVSGYISKVLTAAESSSTLIVGLGVYTDVTGSDAFDRLTFGAGSTDGLVAGSTPAITVNIATDHSVRVYAGWGPAGNSSVTQSGGSAGTLLAQSSPLSTFIGAWKYLEVKVTSTRVIVNVEDIEVINVAHSGGTLDNIFFWGGFQMDDIYILNGTGAPNTFVGTGARVEVARPVGDHSVAWNLFGGGPNHWSALDSDNASGDPIDGAGSVYTDVTGDIDLFDVTDLTLDVDDTILGVVVGARGWQILGPRSLAMVAKVGATTVQAAETPLAVSTASPLDRAGVFNTQPSGSAWDESSFNAAKFGIKNGTGTGTYAQVDRLVIQTLILNAPPPLGGWGVGFVRMGTN